MAAAAAAAAAAWVTHITPAHMTVQKQQPARYTLGNQIEPDATITVKPWE
jgi:hypothetical protein